MNKKDYLKDLFEYQLKGLNRQAENHTSDVEHLTSQLSLAKKDLEKTLKLVKHVKEELDKLNEEK